MSFHISSATAARSTTLRHTRGVVQGVAVRMKTVAFDRKPKSNHTDSSLRNATPFSARRARPATEHCQREAHALSKKSQISLGATDTILCVRVGDRRPVAGYRERLGLVVSLVGNDTHDHKQIQNIIGKFFSNSVRRCATTREKPEHSKEEKNEARSKHHRHKCKRDPEEMPRKER